MTLSIILTYFYEKSQIHIFPLKHFAAAILKMQISPSVETVGYFCSFGEPSNFAAVDIPSLHNHPPKISKISLLNDQYIQNNNKYLCIVFCTVNSILACATIRIFRVKPFCLVYFRQVVVLLIGSVHFS